ncbi:MAG: carbohydrate kinase [Chitinophagaceae bacterium]
MDSQLRNQKVVCFGEILWDLLPAGAMPGGAPLNVAYHLQKLGNTPSLISRIGNDDQGERLLQVLKTHGLSTEYMQTDDVHPTGIVHAFPGANNEVVYDIVAPAAWDFIAATETQSQLPAEADYFVYGSLSSRNDISRATLLQLLEGARTKVFDVNLRSPHYTREVITRLMQGVSILKLNEAELILIGGWYGAGDDAAEGLKQLQDKLHIPTIVVTKGGDGALLLHEGNLYEHQGFKVTVADTVGSGDAFLAALLHGLGSGWKGERALNYASGLGALIASHTGACPAYEAGAIEELVHKNTTSQV